MGCVSASTGNRPRKYRWHSASTTSFQLLSSVLPSLRTMPQSETRHSCAVGCSPSAMTCSTGSLSPFSFTYSAITLLSRIRK